MRKLLALSALVLLVGGLSATSTAQAESLQVPHKPWNKMTRQQKIVVLKKQIHQDHCIISFWKHHAHIRGITWRQTNWLLSHGHRCLV
jgi:hypothetical protein